MNIILSFKAGNVAGDFSIFGGYVTRTGTGDASANRNTITVNTGGTLDAGFWGGCVSINQSGSATGKSEATANNNTITVNTGGTVKSNVGAGLVFTWGKGDNAQSAGSANNNTITISGTVNGYIENAHAHVLTTGDGTVATADSSNNTITVNTGGMVGDRIRNNLVFVDAVGANAKATANANGNAITVNGTVAGVALSGHAQVYARGDGTVAISNSDNNTITVNTGGLVNGDVIGSSITAGAGGTNASSTASASGNTIIINGTVKGAGVYGGMAWAGGNATSSTVAASAINNTISVGGAAEFNPDASTGTVLYGGSAESTFSGAVLDARTGNTLQMRTKNVTVRDIHNFEYLHFYLPNNIAAGETMLALSNTGGADITESKVGVAIEGGSSVLQKGERVALIHATGGDLITNAGNLQNAKGMQGVSLIYDFTLSKDNNHLYATLKADEGVKVNPQAKSLSEGQIGSAAFVNQAADTVAGTGMARALVAAQTGVGSFGGISGGSSRYKSGSHVDVKGFGLMAGAATNLPNSAGNLMLGGFFEAGWGNYNSYNSFADGSEVKANGDNRYYGVGMLARQDFASKLYVEGSARIGRLENDYTSADLKDSFGNRASYKMKKTYYGAHLGAGYLLPLGAGEVDLSAKYLFTQQKGGKQTIFGDVFTFEDINSQRTHLGAAYSYPLNTNTALKVGAAWEYEFDGKAKASVHGLGITAPEIKGSTGVLDVGIKVSPASNKNLSFEAGVQGYAGKRQGVTGNVAVKYLF